MLKDFFQPQTIKETISLTSQYGSESKLVAGGTDIMVNYKTKKLKIQRLISISAVKELAGISSESGGSLRIGATTVLNDIIQTAIVKEAFPILAEAALEVGCHSIRNRATIGGNLCNASPAGDISPALIALGATLEITGSEGTRSLPAEDFILGPGQTALKNNEILTAIKLPSRSKQGSKFLKLKIRKVMEISIVSAACVIEASVNKKCTYARLVLGAVAPVPLLVGACTEILTGVDLSNIDHNAIQKIADAASALSSPISDIRASAEYRKKTAGTLAKRALQMAWQKAGGDV